MQLPKYLSSKELTALGRKALLDRYARKATKTDILEVGDLVIVCTDKESGQREIGTVSSLDADGRTVQVQTEDGNTYSLDTEDIDKPIETDPQDVVKRVARAMSKVEEKPKKWERQFNQLMSTWKFVPGGRILAGAGIQNETPLTFFNCNVIPAPKDSREGILDTAKILAELFSRGAGVGTYLSSLRPRYAYVKGVNGRSSGSVSWGSLYSHLTGLIEQGGSRRGAAMLVLHVWHPDIYEFIDCKREPKAKQLTLMADKLEYGLGLNEYAAELRDLAGKWPANIQHANLSVGITDDFMKAVIHDLDWQLVFPDTNAPEYAEVWDGDIEKWKSMDLPVKVHKIVKARDLWNKLMYAAWDSAEPGVLYIDTVNNNSTSWWYCKLLATNPCITGDTRIAVADGRQAVSIKQLAEEGKDVPVFCTTKEGGVRVRWGRNPRLTRKNHEVWKVTLDDGSTIRATPDHNFMLRDGSSKKLQELDPGDSLMPFVKGKYLNFNRDDWWINSSDGHHGVDREARIVAEFKDGRWPKDFPEEVVHHKDGDHWNNSYDNVQIKTNKSHIFDHTSGMNNPMFGQKHTSITGNSSEERHQESVKKGANTDEGKKSRKSAAIASARTKALKQGKWVLDTYGDILEDTWDDHRINYRNETDTFPSIQAKKIPEIFSSWEDFKEQSSGYNHKVISVSFDSYEDVYNITVDEHHNYAIVTNDSYLPSGAKNVKTGGVFIFNCGEQPLPSNFGVCNLGALNLPRFLMEDPENPNNIILDKESYKNALHTSIRFLDNVIDTTPYFFEAQETNSKRERRIGLSPFMGLAEALIVAGIRYGSEEAVDFVEDIGAFSAEEVLKASVNLAEEKGCCAVLETEEDRKKFLAGKFIQRVLRYMNPDERTILEGRILQFGCRNVSLTTSAPTGTIGTMVATSTGIEPFFRFEYQQNTNLGVHIKRERVLDEWYHQHGENSEVPDYFVSAKELKPLEHVKMVSALQRWIDSAISKTYNLPKEYTPEDVGSLYMEIWKRKCKGGTVYRDGSRTLQVLEDINPEDRSSIALDFPEKTPGPPKGEKKDGQTWSFESPSGTLHATFNQYPTSDNPFEAWLRIGKGGSDVNAMTEAFGRVVSLYLQTRSPIPPMRRMEMLIEQLDGIGGRDQVGFGPNKVRSIPDAVAKAMAKQLDYLRLINMQKEDASGMCLEDNSTPSSVKKNKDMDLCPECGSFGLRLEEGCTSCAFCGYSKC